MSNKPSHNDKQIFTMTLSVIAASFFLFTVFGLNDMGNDVNPDEVTTYVPDPDFMEMMTEADVKSRKHSIDLDAMVQDARSDYMRPDMERIRSLAEFKINQIWSDCGNDTEPNPWKPDNCWSLFIIDLKEGWVKYKLTRYIEIDVDRIGLIEMETIERTTRRIVEWELTLRENE